MEDLKEILRTGISSSIRAKQQILDASQIVDELAKVVSKIVDVYNNDGKVLFCGNGGSAADAQHLSAELSGRYKIDRRPLFSEALHVCPRRTLAALACIALVSGPWPGAGLSRLPERSRTPLQND